MLVKWDPFMKGTANWVWLIITARYGLQKTGGPFGLGSVMWIGATNEAVEGSFVWWPAGNPVNFEAWDSEQPDNRDGSVGQDCVTYVYGPKRWHDCRCSFVLDMFICEGWGRTYGFIAHGWLNLCCKIILQAIRDDFGGQLKTTILTLFPPRFGSCFE